MSEERRRRYISSDPEIMRLVDVFYTDVTSGDAEDGGIVPGIVAVRDAVIEALAAEAESIAAAVADSAWNTTADWLRGHLGDTEATDE